jgi:outer membrane receptor protein involved in Fe transport
MLNILRAKPLMILTSFLLSSLAINGQQLKGFITNEKNAPISGATLIVYRLPDSLGLAVATSDALGYYQFNNGWPDGLIKAEAAGYVASWKQVPVASGEINFKLIADHTLTEFTLAASKPVVEHRADRSIFNIENSVAADAGDAYMALKKTPGVQVMQSQIMIDGKGGVSIMLNGRLQQLAGDDLVQLLRSIPSSTLSKIEVITAPGVKYDAEGSNGIINIVTKKNLKMGLRGNLSGACTRNMYYSPSGSASLQYRTGKLSLFSNNSIEQWNWLYTGITSVYFGDQRTVQTNNVAYSTTNGRIHLGGDYALTDKTTLGFSYARGFGGSENDEDIRAITYSGNWVPDSSARTRGHTSENYKDRNTANLNYEWKIDSTGRKLNIDADYFNQATDRVRNFRVNDYQGNESALTGFEDNRTYSNSSVAVRSLKADLELPYSFIRLSVGAKASFVNNEGAFEYQTKKAEDYVTDSNRANRFLFDEQIQAGYISGQKKIGKLDVKAGIRVERTWNKGFTPVTGQIYTRDYARAFPSLGLQYSLSDNHSLAFNYNRRINRPGYNLLNPFRFYLNPSSYIEGNAGLQPSFTDAFDLTWFIGQRYFIRLNANQVHNYWDRLYFTDSSAGTTSLTRANVGNAAFYTVNFNASQTITKWWEIQGFAAVQYSRFTLHAYEQNRFFASVNGWIDLSHTFYLNKNKTLIAELHTSYYTPRQKDYKRWEEMSLVDGGLKALLFDKNLTLGFIFDDLFQKAYWDQKNSINGTEEFSYDNARLVTISANWKFGNSNLKSKRDRSEANEEIQRAK